MLESVAAPSPDLHPLPRSAARLLVDCLAAEAIPYVLGVPGEENAEFLLALEDSTIEFIQTRHEQGAAFAASAYAKLTGRPLACLGTLGPGAANLVTGVADADMDRVPLLVLTGQGSTDRLHKESHQIMDVVRMFEPITRWAISVRDVGSIPEIVRKAVGLTRSERPGAVLIELPEDVASETTSAQPITPPSTPKGALSAAFEDAAAALATAEKPFILSGNGVLRAGAAPSVGGFAEQFGVPVVSTFMGKGVVPLDSPECLFTIGIHEYDPISMALGDADVVLAVGYDFVEHPPSSWRKPGTTVIHVDPFPAEVDESYLPAIEVVGDIASSMDAIAATLGDWQVADSHRDAYGELRRSMLEEFGRHADDDAEGSIRPQKMISDLRKALGPNDVLLSGVGAHKMWLARNYHCHTPNTCLIPNGFCSMGQALPGLIGAKLARPEQRCVAVCGDGDVLMNVQEMETIARLDLDVTVVVWEDHAYGLIEWKQEAEFGRHTDLTFLNPEWETLASAFGWRGEFVSDSADFGPALRRALDYKGPSLLVAPVDYRENKKLSDRLGQPTCRI